MAAVGGAVGGVLASWNLDCGETLGLKGVESDWPHGILSVMRHCGGGDGCGGNGRCDGDGGAASGAAAGVRGCDRGSSEKTMRDRTVIVIAQ